MLLTGTHPRTLDDKKRLALPKRVREQLGKIRQLYVTPGADQTLWLYDPRGLENLIRGISEGAIRGKYAITGSIAANRVAPSAPPRLAMLYVDNVGSAAAALKIRPTETGANVMLLAPFDDVVFERTWKDGGLTLVAPSQAAVDLLTSPGRAPSEAEAILERLAGTKP